MPPDSNYKGFLASLFDVSFTNLITPRVIKVVYIITLIVIALGAIAFGLSSLITGLASGSIGSIIGGLFLLLIVAPLVALLYTIYSRIILELFIAIFRIMEYNGELLRIAREVEDEGGGAPPPPPMSPPPGPQPTAPYTPPS